MKATYQAPTLQDSGSFHERTGWGGWGFGWGGGWGWGGWGGWGWGGWGWGW
jgi:hypothetical protein